MRAGAAPKRGGATSPAAAKRKRPRADDVSVLGSLAANFKKTVSFERSCEHTRTILYRDAALSGHGLSFIRHEASASGRGSPSVDTLTETSLPRLPSEADSFLASAGLD